MATRLLDRPSAHSSTRKRSIDKIKAPPVDGSKESHMAVLFSYYGGVDHEPTATSHPSLSRPAQLNPQVPRYRYLYTLPLKFTRQAVLMFESTCSSGLVFTERHLSVVSQFRTTEIAATQSRLTIYQVRDYSNPIVC